MTQEPLDTGGLVQPFRVLLVCEANHCRSPLAEHLLRAQISQHPAVPWVVSSAGLRAPDGVPAHPHVERVLRERGVNSEGWVSRGLSPQLVTDADLILTAELAHRRHIVRLQPAAVAKTFPLLTFATWLRNAGPAVSSAPLLDRAMFGRARTQPMAPRTEELADPLGHSLRRFRACARLLDDAFEPFISPVS